MAILNTWTHLAFAWGPNSLSVYVDGVAQTRLASDPYNATLKNDTFYAITDHTSNIQMGSRAPLAVPYGGRAADFRTYNRTLSAEEIKAIHSAYPRGSDGVINGITGRWMNNFAQTGSAISDGTLVQDLSGFGRNGYATNGVISASSIIGNRRTK
jgi:hypothetical protein